ncbi:serine/arginine repetitive matrix protein 2-like isoform X2 [Elgaria multicarinata webbii]|uniref:serine/arginine repetitive matrix protein 2-like isoform X2 n=1 Tax=Elgaria multicarinata webbii TaxID=159646 RepID=UPI002FCD2C6E
MNRGFPHYWPRFPRRGRGGWFRQDHMPDENFWREHGWNEWGNCSPDRPPPHWDQCYPEQQRAYDGNNYIFQGRGRPRGYSHGKRPYFREKRGRPYRGSKRSFSKERGGFQKSSCSIDSTQNKKEHDSEKVKAQSTASKKAKQGKKDSAALVNKTDPPKVQLKDSQASEDPLSQTALAKAPTEEQAPSETTEHLPTMEKEDPVPVPESKQDVNLPTFTSSLRAVEPLVPLETEETIPPLENVETEQVTLKVQQDAKDPPNQTVPMPSAGESTEEQTPSETTEGLHFTEQEESVLLEAEYSGHGSSPLSEEIPLLFTITDDHQCEKKEEIDLLKAECSRHGSSPLSEEIPLLFTITDDHQCEKKEEIDLTQISSSCEDVHRHHTCVAPAVHSSSLPSTFSDIWCVPVLVRGGQKKLHYSWKSASFLAENPSGWAPEDYQEPPWSVSQAGKCNKVSENVKGSVLSQSPPHTLISCNLKCDTERLLEYRSCSPKSHHSSDSKHSSSNWTPRELRVQSSRSPRRQKPSSRSPRRHHSRSPQGHRSRSPQGHRSRSPHGHRSTSPCRRKYCSRSPHRREYSPQRQEKSSRSPWRRREHSCNPSQENSWKRDSPSYYLAHKISHHDSLKERSKTYEAPLSYSPESPTLVCKMKTKSQKIKKKKITQPERTEKKKTSSRRVTKSIKIKKKARLTPSAVEAPVPSETAQNFPPLRTEESEQLAASSENTDSFHHPSAEEETRFSASSCTPYDHSAAVLTRKEEIEQAYLQAVLNFAVVAAMLVEKEPCMEKAMESALRANLRRIAGYYEQLLKNYIDNLA